MLDIRLYIHTYIQTFLRALYIYIYIYIYIYANTILIFCHLVYVFCFCILILLLQVWINSPWCIFLCLTACNFLLHRQPFLLTCTTEIYIYNHFVYGVWIFHLLEKFCFIHCRFVQVFLETRYISISSKYIQIVFR